MSITSFIKGAVGKVTDALDPWSGGGTFPTAQEAADDRDPLETNCWGIPPVPTGLMEPDWLPMPGGFLDPSEWGAEPSVPTGLLDPIYTDMPPARVDPTAYTNCWGNFAD